MRGNAKWLRVRTAVRALTLAILLSAPVAVYSDLEGNLLPLLAIAAAFVTPLLWPRLFGSWRGFWLLLLATVAPFFLTRWGLWSVDSPFAFVGALLWYLVGLFMLPGTILMLLWRRWASVNLILLCFALTPLAIVIFLLTQTFGADPLAGTPQEAVEAIGIFIPWMALMMGLCLAPIFFVGSLLWLVYQESGGGAGVRA
jgi:hypothetical protein